MTRIYAASARGIDSGLSGRFPFHDQFRCACLTFTSEEAEIAKRETETLLCLISCHPAPQNTASSGSRRARLSRKADTGLGLGEGKQPTSPLLACLKPCFFLSSSPCVATHGGRGGGCFLIGYLRQSVAYLPLVGSRRGPTSSSSLPPTAPYV